MPATAAITVTTSVAAARSSFSSRDAATESRWRRLYFYLPAPSPGIDLGQLEGGNIHVSHNHPNAEIYGGPEGSVRCWGRHIPRGHLVLWLYGLVIDRESRANFIPVNTADNRLHFVLGAAMIALGVLLTRALR